MSGATERPPGPASLQITLSVDSADRWAQTWKPLIDGLECQAEHVDVIPGVVGAGVAWPQQHAHRLARAGFEADQRVFAIRSGNRIGRDGPATKPLNVHDVIEVDGDLRIGV